MMQTLTRIAYVVSTLKRSGPSSQLLYIIRHLDRRKFDPVVVTLSPESDDSMKPQFEQAGMPVRTLGLSRMAGFFLASSALRKLLIHEDAGLLHTQGLRADSLAAGFCSRWPSVCSLRNFPQLDYPMTYGTLRGRWMAHVHARALEKIDAPVGVSFAVSSNLKDVFGIHSYTICNGVDTKVWAPFSAERQENIRRELNLPGKGRVWVSVGHLSERKNPMLLIDAFKDRALREDRLIFLGNGPLEAPVRSAAKGCFNILVPGRVANVADYLHAADGFISASTAEGFPNAVLEALACGLPCVLSDILPHREIADLAGACVRIFPENDLAKLVSAVRNQNLTEDGRCSARLAAEQRFSASAMSSRYQSLYCELLEGLNE
jgi:glycosyltransferase involved in cell wall biosynthesis